MLTFKIVAIIVIAAAGVFGGLLTLRPSFDRTHTGNLNLGNAFAGGVFLGAGFLHMLPDGLDNFSSLNLAGDYPYGLLTAAIGFLLIMLIDKGLSAHDTAEKIKESNNFPTILFLVLAIHSIIAGMSLGLEEGFLSGLVILIAIIAHKGSAAFALGLNMVQAQCAEALVRRTILFFAFMTPLGVVLGSLLSAVEAGQSSVFFEAIFDTLAAGTFLYIATLEIISELFENHTQKTSKLMMILLGFALMATIAIWT
jgi:zinc transporter 1/2/3